MPRQEQRATTRRTGGSFRISPWRSGLLLHHLLSIDLSIRIFLALTVGQLFLGTLALHYACSPLRQPAAGGGALCLTGRCCSASSILFWSGLGALGVCACGCAGASERFRFRSGLLAAVALLAHLIAFCIIAPRVSCWAGIAASRRSRGSFPRARSSAAGRELLHWPVPAALYLAAIAA